MSKLFHLIEDASVILRTRRGVYRQAKLYHKGADVYASHGSGFVRLVAGFGTSCPDILWSDLDGRGLIDTPRIGNPKFSDFEEMRKAA